MASERLNFEFRHSLRRCPKLSDAEIRFLSFISSYSHGCFLSYEEICNLTNWSRSKLSRTIRSLEKYKLIDIKYRSYKRTTIKIAPASRQAEFANAHNVSWVTQGPYVTDESEMSHTWNSDVSPLRQPILKKELEREIETESLEYNDRGSVDVQGLIAKAFPNWARKMTGSS